MPKIDTSALLERLAKGQPIPGILLLGAETYLRDLCRKAIVEAIVPRLREGDVIAVLSNGGFDGIYEKLPAHLAARGTGVIQ